MSVEGNIERQAHWRIDNAKPGDGEGIAAVRKQGWQSTYPNLAVGITTEDIESTDFDTPEKLSEWEGHIANQGEEQRIWVARDNGRIIAYCFAKKEPSPEVEGLYVLPEYKGEGLGKALMNDALAWLGDKEEVAVWIFSGNTPAKRFYEKHGFVESGTTDEPVVNGNRVPALEMRKSLFRSKNEHEIS